MYRTLIFAKAFRLKVLYTTVKLSLPTAKPNQLNTNLLLVHRFCRFRNLLARNSLCSGSQITPSSSTAETFLQKPLFLKSND